MRIALVCSEVIRNSGHGRYMLELARRFAADHDVHVYADLHDPLPGVTFHHVPSPLGLTNLVRVFAFRWRASRALAGEAFDIVHTIGGCCARRDVVTAQFLQRPWIRQMGLTPPAERVGSLLHRVYHAIYYRACDWLEAPAFRITPAQRLIAVSGSVRDELKTFYGVDPAKVAVIFNGVEPDEWSQAALAPLRAPTRAALGVPEDVPLLLFVGEFYRKGLRVTLEALARQAEPRPHLLIVGRGEETAYRLRAKDLGVDDLLHFIGFQKDVRPYFAASDMFVFPTRYEPFGMVVTEAMAAGMPVVTTQAAGAAEVITAGQDGEVIADSDDVAGFAAAIAALLADPARRMAMGEAARATAAGVDWDYVARATMAIYLDLEASKARAR